MKLAVALLLVLATGCTHLVWYGRSLDRRHVVAVLEAGGRQRVRFDMVDGPVFRGVAVDALVVTDDGHVAYPAQTDDGWVVVHDGVAGPTFDAIGELVFAHGVLAYAAERKGAWSVITPSFSPLGERVGERAGAFTSILAHSLTISATGRVAWAAQRDRETFIIIDDTVHGPYDGAGLIRFSADGTRVGFTSRSAGATTVHLEAQTLGPFDAVTELRLGPPDAFIATKDRATRVYVDGIATEPVDRAAGLLVDGEAAAFVTKRGDESWVIDGATRRGPFRAVTSTLQRDALGRLVFAAKTPENNAHVFTGDSRSEPYAEVSPPVVAGAHVGFIGTEPQTFGSGPPQEQGAWVVLDGKAGPRWTWAESLALSRDGARFAHLAGRGSAMLLVVDGDARPVDIVVSGTLAFSRDGRRFGCVMGDRKSKRLFVQRDDGRRVPVDMEELVAALSRQPEAQVVTAPDAELLRRWVEAELERP